MKPLMNKQKVVFFTGAGIRAESGLETFRDTAGMWNKIDVMSVASTTGWQQNPGLVLDFFNQRRQNMLQAKPNAAHHAIAELQAKYEVLVITQNIDDLHERAGSRQVIHLHGSVLCGRSSAHPDRLYPISEKGIQLGDLCEFGSQIRPNIVWFGESVHNMEEAKRHVIEAGTVVAIGSSLIVQPAAGLLRHARFHANKMLITLEVGSRVPFGFRWIRAKASECTHLIKSL